MSKQVFISHSNSDADIANRICNIIEKLDIQCWIAPRDVRPGHKYPKEIIYGIKSCKAMIILVSDHSNNSEMVSKEIELAINQGKSIFPIRIQNIEPGESLEFYLAGIEWVDAWKPPLEEHLKKLIQVLQELLEIKSDDQKIKTVNAEDRIKETPKSERVEIKHPSKNISQPIVDPKVESKSIPSKTPAPEKKVTTQKGSPKAIDPSIVKLVEIKTRMCDSSRVDGCKYNTFLNSNVAAIYNKNLSSDCSYDNFLWLLDQALDSDEDEILRTRNLLLALEYGKRHRSNCDYELIQRDSNDAPYIIQELIINHLIGSPLREHLFKKAKEWVFAVRFRSLQAKLVKIIGSVSTEEVIAPLIEVALLQNDNSIEALNILSNYHQECIYNLANDLLYGESGWIIGAAANIIAKYPEYVERSMEGLKNAFYPALNSLSPENAVENILKAMWSLNPNETVDCYTRERHLLTTNKSAVKIKYLEMLKIFNIDLITLDSKVKLLELSKEILNSDEMNDLYFANSYKQQFQKKIEELEKQLK